MCKDLKESPANPILMPTVYNHFVTAPRLDEANCGAYFCRRETPYMNKISQTTVKSMTPIVKSIVDYENNQMLTQIAAYGRPTQEKLNLSRNSLGFVELVDFDEKTLRYLEIPKPLDGKDGWKSYTHLNVTNEAEFLLDLSATTKGNFFTLDFHGNLSEWETGKLNLARSLDEWQKIIMDRESKELRIETFNASPNTELKEFKGPKHGQVDPKNEPHVGGNTWAGGSGGFDTAGMGGVGGFYLQPIFKFFKI